MKYFISQPMKGLTEAEIKQKRDDVIKLIYKQDRNAMIIDSYISAFSPDSNPLWFLAKSIEKLSEADVAYFVKGFEEARGCKIEFECARAYGIDTRIVNV